jgi:hypothetical protein
MSHIHNFQFLNPSRSLLVVQELYPVKFIAKGKHATAHKLIYSRQTCPSAFWMNVSYVLHRNSVNRMLLGVKLYENIYVG